MTRTLIALSPAAAADLFSVDADAFGGFRQLHVDPATRGYIVEYASGKFGYQGDCGRGLVGDYEEMKAALFTDVEARKNPDPIGEMMGRNE